MQASRDFIMMLVLIASAFAPVLSAPLECVVFTFISCHIATADLFVVLVEYAYWNNVRSDDASCPSRKWATEPVANVCMFGDSIVTGTTTVLHGYPRDEFNHISLLLRSIYVCVNCSFFRRLPATTFAFELQTTPFHT